MLDTVLNQLVGTLDASGAAIYFSESGGFKLRGVSKELYDSYLPEFLPYGAGIPTYVLRESRACRLSIQQDLEGDKAASGMFMDLDNRSKHLLRMQDMPPYRSEICLPVFYGTQILGVLEVGWKRPQAPLAYDVNVLEVICDYLSIQLVGMASSLRSRRTAELGRSLNVLRDELFTFLDDSAAATQAVSSEICNMLNCHFCPVEYDASLDSYVIDFEGGSRVALPDDPEKLFFSTTAPAARLGAAPDGFEASVLGGTSAEDLKHVRITRVDESMPMGGWLGRMACLARVSTSTPASRRGARALRAMASTVTTRSFLLLLRRVRRRARCCFVIVAKSRLMTLNMTTWCTWLMTLN